MKNLFNAEFTDRNFIAENAENAEKKTFLSFTSVTSAHSALKKIIDENFKVKEVS